MSRLLLPGLAFENSFEIAPKDITSNAVHDGGSTLLYFFLNA